MKRKRGYTKPGLRSFDSDRLKEDAAMAFLQAGSPTELECTPTTQPPDPPCVEDVIYCPMPPKDIP